MNDGGDQIYRVSGGKYKTIHLHACDDDKELSWKAVGLLTFLLTRPPGWKFWEADLIRRHSDGETSVRTGLQELKDRGYLKTRRIRGEGGRFLRREWLCSEKPLQTDAEWEESFPSLDDHDEPRPSLSTAS